MPIQWAATSALACKSNRERVDDYMGRVSISHLVGKWWEDGHDLSTLSYYPDILLERSRKMGLTQTPFLLDTQPSGETCRKRLFRRYRCRWKLLFHLL